MGETFGGEGGGGPPVTFPEGAVSQKKKKTKEGAKRGGKELLPRKLKKQRSHVSNRKRGNHYRNSRGSSKRGDAGNCRGCDRIEGGPCPWIGLPLPGDSLSGGEGADSHPRQSARGGWGGEKADPREKKTTTTRKGEGFLAWGGGHGGERS